MVITIIFINLQCDEFPVSEKVALQLAGLQAQVSLGEPSAAPSGTQNAAYYEPHLYLPPRVAKLRPHPHWVSCAYNFFYNISTW